MRDEKRAVYFNSRRGGCYTRGAMQCTLHIPHLIPPPDVASVWEALRAPHLKTLLARARYSCTAPRDGTAVLCELFGLDGAQADGLAPLLARADGLAAEDGYWLCATPVHLETRHHALVLKDPALLQLSAEQSAALAATLNDHLRADNLALHAPRPGQWYLHCQRAPAITTTPVTQAVGHDIDAFLPRGTDALRWHRLMTEIQMLLHAHAVNDAREAAGQLPVNSVWFWGGGRLPERLRTPFRSVWSDDALTRALARHAGIAPAAAPSDLGTITLDEGHHFFSCHTLTPLLQRGDFHTWSTSVTALENRWFVPLHARVKARAFACATLISNGHAATHRFIMRPWDTLKIFNKNNYLRNAHNQDTRD